MYSIKELYKDIEVLAGILEENEVDTFRFTAGIGQELIERWECENVSKLPQGYKEFIGLCNGFRYCGTEVFPLERVEVLSVPDEFEGYYCIGTYIGDGSLILSDRNGKCYYGDHAFGIKEVEFETFVQDDMLRHIKEVFVDNNMEIPENIYTRESKKEKPILSHNRYLEILEKIKAEKEKE